MVEILRGILPYLGGAIGVLLLVVLVRETWRSFWHRHVKSQEEACEDLIKRVHHLTTEGLAAVALELKKTFSMEVVEAVLDRTHHQITEEKRTDEKRKLANLYDHLGLVEKYVRELKGATSWTLRAAAGEKLGQIGHPAAVLPLISLLQDSQEETEVKSVATRALGKIRDPRAISPLVESLGSEDPTTGQPLADVLTQFGKEVVPALTETLKVSTSEGQRTWSARILGRIQATDSIPSLLNALSDHSEKVREAAVQSLGKIKDRRAVRSLNDLLIMDPSPLVRETSAQALGEIGDEKAFEYLKRALGDMEYGARRKAMEALEGMGEKAWPIFVEVLKSGDPRSMAQAALGLERGGYVAKMVEALINETPGIRSTAYDLLLQVAKAGVAETLIQSLSHQNFKIRVRLCEILKEARHPRALESLLDLSQKDLEWPVRLKALEALIALGNEKVIPIILKALREEGESTKEALLVAMTRLSPSLLISMIPDLIPLLHDTNLEVRLKAVSLIGLIPADGVILPLLTSLKDSSPHVREEAAASLGQFSGSEAFVQEMVDALKDPEFKVRLAVVRSLGKIRNPCAIPALARSFEWADNESREEIATALALMPVQEFLKLMDELMGLDHPKSRAGIAWTLGLLPDPKGLTLATFFLKDKDPLVRSAAAGAVGKFFEIRGGTQEIRDKITKVMIEYLSDPSEYVRAAVVNSLGKIGDPQGINHLLNLLETEPDRFVTLRALLAIGCLAPEGVSPKGVPPKSVPPEGEDQAKLPIVLERIHQWMEKADREEEKVAMAITLTLWGETHGRAIVVSSFASQGEKRKFKNLLMTLPKRIQDRFLKILLIDRELFFREEIGVEVVAGHYQGLLVTSHLAKERKYAIIALSLLKVAAALPAIESSFSKDPDAEVRAAALQALSKTLTGESLIEKVIIAAGDPSDLLRQEVVSLLKGLPRCRR